MSDHASPLLNLHPPTPGLCTLPWGKLLQSSTSPGLSPTTSLTSPPASLSFSHLTSYTGQNAAERNCQRRVSLLPGVLQPTGLADSSALPFFPRHLLHYFLCLLQVFAQISSSQWVPSWPPDLTLNPSSSPKSHRPNVSYSAFSFFHNLSWSCVSHDKLIIYVSMFCFQVPAPETLPSLPSSGVGAPMAEPKYTWQLAALWAVANKCRAVSPASGPSGRTNPRHKGHSRVL